MCVLTLYIHVAVTTYLRLIKKPQQLVLLQAPPGITILGTDVIVVVAVPVSLCVSIGFLLHTQPQSASSTGLIVAAQYGRDEMVHLLVSSGADPNVQTTVSVE